MFHVEVNLVYICYLVNLVFFNAALWRPTGCPMWPSGRKVCPPLIYSLQARQELHRRLQNQLDITAVPLSTMSIVNVRTHTHTTPHTHTPYHTHTIPHPHPFCLLLLGRYSRSVLIQLHSIAYVNDHIMQQHSIYSYALCSSTPYIAMHYEVALHIQLCIMKQHSIYSYALCSSTPYIAMHYAAALHIQLCIMQQYSIYSFDLF